MCRTLRFEQPFKKRSKKEQEIILKIRDQITGLLKDEVGEYIGKNLINKESFDTWHHTICEGISDLYKKSGIRFKKDYKFCYGQAQKWVNMFFKYLCVLKEDSIERLIPFLHVPIDNHILYKSEFKDIRKPSGVWSSWDETKYKEYQETLKNSISIKYSTTEVYPIIWELDNWNIATEQNEEQL